MIGTGTLVNAAAIVIGSSIGLLLGHKLPARIQSTLIKIASLTTIGIGMQMFLEMKYILIVLPSLIVGAVIGETLKIENRVEQLGSWMKKIVRSKSETFLEGFVTTSILYCVGPMAILGALADGLSGQHNILFTKSILDGTVSISFAAAWGAGVAFSAVPILIYQGLLTVVGILLGHFFSALMIRELTATGGLLMIAIGLNVLGVFEKDKKIPLGNLLPAILLAPLAAWAYEALTVFLK